MKDNVFITVFTPTYNRGYTLKKLYNSLKKQSDNDFEWLIIDDGSTDDTKSLVKDFIKENKVNIRYMYKKNEGKYKAINTAIDLAKGELFFIVDSDDWITEDSIETIKKYYSEIKDNNEFIGVVGLRGTPDMKINCSLKKEKENKFLKLEYIDATPVEYKFKYHIIGDRAEVCITKKMKEFKFPENDEKFMNEGYIWNNIAKCGYKFRYFNKIIYIGNYLNDGLTLNIKKIERTSPKNMTITKNLIVGIKEIPLKERFKACVGYYRYGFLANMKQKELFKASNNKCMSFLAIPLAIILNKINY